MRIQSENKQTTKARENAVDQARVVQSWVKVTQG